MKVEPYGGVSWMNMLQSGSWEVTKYLRVRYLDLFL